MESLSFSKHRRLSGIFVFAFLFVTSGVLFSQISYTFTNASALGQTGPTQIQVNNSYTSTSLSGSVTISVQGIQQWTVPVTAVYKIEAFGAQGGNASGYTGGLGASMAGEFSLVAGDIVKILVGQLGANGGIGGGFYMGGGGGGGSYVTVNNILVIAAGGGGGAGIGELGANGFNGNPALTGTGGNIANGTNNNPNGAPGTNGNGGVGSAYYGAAGGAGWLTNGGNSTGSSISSGGIRFLVSGVGGAGGSYSSISGGSGGFGGGGGATFGGGGGGGYSGGGSGTHGANYNATGGGGGGSFNGGTNQTNVVGINSGHGKVIITKSCNISLIATGTNSNGALCAGSSVTLTTDAISNYSWSTGATTSSLVLNPASTTVISLSAMSPSSCISSANIILTVNSTTPALTLTNSANGGTVCATKTVVLTAGGANSYSWASSANPLLINGVAFTPTVTDTYTVTGYNACGSSTAIASVTVSPIPTLAINSGTACSHLAFTINPSGANNYTYTSLTNTNVFTPTSGTYTYAVNGAYTTGCSSSISGTLVTFATPTVAVSNGTLCEGKSFTISPSGAAFYSITGGTNVVSPLAGTSLYTVTGTSTAGCVSQNAPVLSLTTYSIPMVSVNSGTVCSGKAFTMAPSGAINYTYSSGTAIVYPANTTTYSVYGKSAQGCLSNTVVASVTVYISPTISVISGSICAGNVFTINPTGADNYLYAGGSNTVSPLFTTTYSVAGTSSMGCASVNSLNCVVTVVANPTISVNSGTICTGTAFVLTPSAANGYTISGGSATVAPNISTNYTVTTMSPVGCFASAISTIAVLNLPQIGISGPAGVCTGSNSVLTATGALSYTWTTGLSSVSLAIAPGSPTAYGVIGKDINGCTNTALKSITVYSLPQVNISGNTFICQGYVANLLAGGTALTYSWSTGALGSVLSITPTTSSVIIATGTDANGCSNTASVIISALPTPIVTANATNTLLCEGTGAVLSGSGAVSYLWSGGITDNTVFFPSVTSTYTVSGTAGNGCKNTATITLVINPLPAVTVTSTSQHLCPGQSATLNASGANIYKWGTGELTPKIVISPTTTASYTVIGTDANSCSVAIVFTQSASECLGFKSLINYPLINIFPNPNNGIFNIHSDSQLNFILVNEFGQTIKSVELSSANSFEVQVNSLSKGVYFIVGEKNGGQIRQKIVVIN